MVGGLVWGSLPTEMAQLGLFELLTDPRVYIAGLKFSIPLLTILWCHEPGHYIAARRHGLTATPPYFIPFPIPVLGIGTLGAVIRIKDPIRDKRQLLDVGAAGPIAGFVALVPFLAYGIAASEVGESVVLHPTGVAAWFGVLVTLLNLLPFAQLDGGHIGYALFGGWHRRMAWPLLGALAGLGFVWPGWWLWVVIALIMKPQHPRLWDEDQPLDRRRQFIGWIAIAIFVLCFVAEPIRIVF
jgi:membrane-associated protease RseP (regulator of RpoE activity)